MNWEKLKTGGVYTTLGGVIDVEIYRSLFSEVKWVYLVSGKKSTQSYKTMREAKNAATEFCKTVLTKALSEIGKEGKQP